MGCSLLVSMASLICLIILPIIFVQGKPSKAVVDSLALFGYLIKNGIYDFWNWFDDQTWYPLGLVIGGTVYPGLTLTAGTMWWILNSLNIPLSLETICVFTAPIFSANAAWATYLLTKEVKGTGAGLTAAALLDMVSQERSRPSLSEVCMEQLGF